MVQSPALPGFFFACLSLFMAVAPLVGGFVNQAWGWRGNYGFVFIMSLVSWGILYFFLPETLKARKKVDITSVSQDYGTLLKSTTFMSAALVPSLFFAAYMVFISASAFLYMETFGLSVLGFVMHQAVIVEEADEGFCRVVDHVAFCRGPDGCSHRKQVVGLKPLPHSDLVEILP